MMKSKLIFTIAALQLITIGLFAGVRQMRTATPTAGQTTYVNPNYSNRATTYRQQTGNTGLTPGQAAAIAGQAGYVTYNGYETPVVGEYYDDYDGYVETSPAGSTIPLGVVLEYVPSSAVPIMVDGSRYYYENNIYYAEVFNGNAVVYQVVDAPLGAVVTQLPAGCVVQNYNGKSFQQCGYTYYQQVAGGYQVVLLN
jgi:uncharacterized protein DUF6515